jgi:hypothetical protein
MWRDLQGFICPRRRRQILEQMEAMTWTLLENIRDQVLHLDTGRPRGN